VPVALRYVTCADFPKLAINDVISNEVQTSLPWGDATTETSITHLGSAEDRSFERYMVLHQVERDVDALYNQEAVRRLIENRRFPAYYERSGGYFLVQAPERDVNGMFDRLAKSDPPIRSEHHQIDLMNLMALGDTTGAYFGNLRIDKVRTAAVFGTTTVVESDEWVHYAEHGDLRVLYMRVMQEDGATRTLQLLTDRSVVLMKDAGEHDNLSFTKELQESIDTLLAS